MSYVAIAGLVISDITKRSQSGDWTGVEGGVFGSGTPEGEEGGAGGAGSSGVYGRTIDLPDYIPHEQTMFNADATARKFANDILPSAIGIAKRETNYGIARRDKLMPGFNGIMAGAGGTLSRWMAGDVPDEVKDATMRSIAEKSGGTAGAGTGYKSDFARAIGKIGAIDLPAQALQLGPTWMKLADSFVVKPGEAYAQIMDFIKTKYGYQSNYDQLAVHQQENIYTSEVNKERSAAMPDPRLLGMKNDAMQIAALNAAMQAKQSQQLAGIASAAVSAYGSSRTGAGTGTSTSVGFGGAGEPGAPTLSSTTV
ncbi:MAG: hypothetical protein JW388_0961 [Nitrospira sp.]|nr:hypothetical protein [Nitrospira sp.]